MLSNQTYGTLILFLGILLWTGCFPHDTKSESRRVTPADSLSKKIAKKTKIQPLDLVWTSANLEIEALKTPQTVKFSPDGQKIYVADAELNKIFSFSIDGKLLGTIQNPDFQFPYLVGFRGDSLYVLNRGTKTLEAYFQGKKVASQPIPDAPMTYATFVGKDTYFKATGFDERFNGYIGKLLPNGEVSDKIAFKAPHWRWLGFLKTWKNQPLSLSGYNPMIDKITNGKIDSLRLKGFDSPVLPRRLLFLQKEVKEAPLLTSSAVAQGDSLFVMNLRAGWIRLDAYNLQGRLFAVAEEVKPQYIEQRIPMDMDVLDKGDHLLFAIVEKNKTPNLSLYKWRK